MEILLKSCCSFFCLSFIVWTKTRGLAVFFFWWSSLFPLSFPSSSFGTFPPVVVQESDNLCDTRASQIVHGSVRFLTQFFCFQIFSGEWRRIWRKRRSALFYFMERVKVRFFFRIHVNEIFEILVRVFFINWNRYLSIVARAHLTNRSDIVREFQR